VASSWRGADAFIVLGLPASAEVRDLRHTHATILLRKGVPVKPVSVRLGHATAMITMTVYAGWMPADHANAAAVFVSRTVAISRAK
jgi:integrase